MILCLDIGNTHVYGGLFADEEIQLRFRCTSKVSTSDEFGIFLLGVLREHHVDKNDIRQVALCSVVPQLDYSIRAACKKYLQQEPFVLDATMKTGLAIEYRNPIEVGADRIANAVAATHLYPEQNLIIIDFGTAITFCVVSARKAYLGGVILPGIRLSMEALQANTAKLPSVEILQPKVTVGRSTIESIQSGLYYGAEGACRAILERVKAEAFPEQKVMVLGTGGFALLFEHSQLYGEFAPDLVLQGMRFALALNQDVQ